jgi:hypothetical protein
LKELADQCDMDASIFRYRARPMDDGFQLGFGHSG